MPPKRVRSQANQPEAKPLSHSGGIKSLLQTRFLDLDKGGTGTLCFEELCTLLHKGNPEMPDESIRMLFVAIDRDGRGYIYFREFLDFIFVCDLDIVGCDQEEDNDLERASTIEPCSPFSENLCSPSSSGTSEKREVSNMDKTASTIEPCSPCSPSSVSLLHQQVQAQPKSSPNSKRVKDPLSKNSSRLKNGDDGEMKGSDSLSALLHQHKESCQRFLHESKIADSSNTKRKGNRNEKLFGESGTISSSDSLSQLLHQHDPAVSDSSYTSIKGNGHEKLSGGERSQKVIQCARLRKHGGTSRLSPTWKGTAVELHLQADAEPGPMLSMLSPSPVYSRRQDESRWRMLVLSRSMVDLPPPGNKQVPSGSQPPDSPPFCNRLPSGYDSSSQSPHSGRKASKAKVSEHIWKP